MKTDQTMKLKALLDGFFMLGNGKINQINAVLDLEEECGACIGAWAAYFLDVHKRNDVWVCEDGIAELGSILFMGSSLKNLSLFLHKHGAPKSPFLDTWDRAPYEVLSDAIFERTGYIHKPPIPVEIEPLQMIYYDMPS